MTIFQEISELNKSIVFTSIHILNKTEILNQLSHIINEPDVEKARKEAQRLIHRLGTAIQIFLLYNRPYQDNPHELMNYMREFLEIKVRDGKDVPKNLGEIREFCNSRTFTSQNITEKLRAYLSNYFDMRAFYNNVTKRNADLYNNVRQLSISLVGMEASLHTSQPRGTGDLSQANNLLVRTEMPSHISQMQERIDSVVFYQKVEKSIKHLQTMLSKTLQTELDLTVNLDKMMIITDSPAEAALKANLLLDLGLKSRSIIFHGKETHLGVSKLESYFDMKSLENLKSLRAYELKYEENDDIAEVAATKKKIVAQFNKDYKAALQSLGEFLTERIIRNLLLLKNDTLKTLTTALPAVSDDKDEAPKIAYIEEFTIVDPTLKMEELTIPEGLNITLINNCEIKFANNILLHLPLLRLKCFLAQVLPKVLASSPLHLKIKTHMLIELEALDKKILQLTENITTFQTVITGNEYAYEKNVKFLETISSLQAVQTYSKELSATIQQADEKNIKILRTFEKKLALHKKSIKELTEAFQTCRDKDYPLIITTSDTLRTRYTALAETLAKMSESFQKLQTEFTELPNDLRNNTRPVQTCSENIASAEKLFKSANDIYSQLKYSSDSNDFRKISVTLDLIDSYIKKISSIIPLVKTFIIEEKQRSENAQIGKQKKLSAQTNQRFFGGTTGPRPAQQVTTPADLRTLNP